MTSFRLPAAGSCRASDLPSRPPTPRFPLRLRLFYCTALTLLSWGCLDFAFSQPRTQSIGVVITDKVNLHALPLHLRDRHAQSLNELRRRVMSLLDDLGRFETAEWSAVANGRRYVYSGPGSVAFVAHLTIHKLGKIYRNETQYYPNYPASASSQVGNSPPYEIISRPAITGRLKIELVELKKNKAFWSALHDSTAIVPHDPLAYIYNPRKHPGFTHPSMIRAHLADIMRLQTLNRSAERGMAMSDRWYISAPGDDIATARTLLADLVAWLPADLDSNLPLEGRIAALVPEKKGKRQVLLNIGARHGLSPRLRLDVWRPLPSAQKVGQIEIVKVDSTTAIARVRKIEKKLRKRGEGPNAGDRVISRKRPSTRRGHP